MNNIKKIKEKITKLLNLSEGVGATQGEIENAIAAATRLMAMHNLSRDDIDFNDSENPTSAVQMGRSFAISKTRYFVTWEHDLISFICEFIGFVNAYTASPEPLRKNGIAILNEDGKQRTGSLVWFYGAAEDCESAVELFEEIREAIAIMSVTRWGAWSRGDGGAYAEGFCLGLSQALKKAVKDFKEGDSQTKALVLRNESNQLAVKKDAKIWLAKEHGIHLRRKRCSGGASGSNEARRDGMKDGLNYNPSRPIKKQKLA